jgi:hypothetical protein
MTPGDDGAGEMKQGEMVGGFPAPSDQDGAAAMEPGVCPLPHPASGLGPSMTPGNDLLTTNAHLCSMIHAKAREPNNRPDRFTRAWARTRQA